MQWSGSSSNQMIWALVCLCKINISCLFTEHVKLSRNRKSLRYCQQCIFATRYYASGLQLNVLTKGWNVSIWDGARTHDIVTTKAGRGPGSNNLDPAWSSSLKLRFTHAGHPLPKGNAEFGPPFPSFISHQAYLRSFSSIVASSSFCQSLYSTASLLLRFTQSTFESAS